MITVVNGYQIAPDCRSARKDDKVVHFTHNEATALSLMLSCNQSDSELDYVPKAEIESKVWESSQVSSNSVRKLMSDIRAKLDGSRDVKIIQNIHNKGYKLIYEQRESASKSSLDVLASKFTKQGRLMLISAVLFYLLVVALLALAFTSLTSKGGGSQSDILYEKVFETDSEIYNIDTFQGDMYVTLSYSDPETGTNSTIVRINGHFVDVMKQSDKPLYYKSLKVSPNGTVAWMMGYRDECVINIGELDFKTIHAQIPCIKENHYSDLFWEDDRFLYLTIKSDKDLSSKPMLYDTRSGQLVHLDNYGFDYSSANGYGSYTVREFDGALYTLNIDKNDLATLNVNTKQGSKVLFEFKHIPRSFEIFESTILFANEKNQFVKAKIPSDPLSDEWDFQEASPQQLLNIHTPTYYDGYIAFVSGQGGNRVVVSSHTNKRFESDLEVLDFYQNGEEIAILGTTANGYKVQLFNGGKLVYQSYHKSDYVIRHVASLNGNIYVGGNDGTFMVLKEGLVRISDAKPQGIASGDDCLYVATSKGVLELLDNELQMLNSQGGRVFSFNEQCVYEDKVSYDLVVGESVMGNTEGEEFVFFHKGQLAYRKPKDGGGHLIVSFENDEVIDSFEGTIAQLRYQSLVDEVLYLTRSKTFNLINRIRVEELH